VDKEIKKLFWEKDPNRITAGLIIDKVKARVKISE